MKLSRTKGLKLNLEVDVSPQVVTNMDQAVRYALTSFELAKKHPDPIIGKARRRLHQKRKDRETTAQSERIQEAVDKFNALSPAERIARGQKIREEIIGK